MMNALRVLKRDILRLLRTPAALVVVGALLVLPSVYTWYNVLGFWDPYTDTGALRVDVVNEDEGASSPLTGELDVGDMIVEKLRENTQLGWEFTDYDTAMEELRSGRSYAVFVIPDDFTAGLLSLTTGNFEQPQLQYYVNEKTGPVAPKITDTGANTLDETINSTFISTVSDVAVNTIEKAADESRDELLVKRSRAAQEADGAIDEIQGARDRLVRMEEAATAARATVAAAQGKLEETKSHLQAIEDEMPGVASAASDVRRDMDAFITVASDATNRVNSALQQLINDYRRYAQEALDRIKEIPGFEDVDDWNDLKDMVLPDGFDPPVSPDDLQALLDRANALSDALYGSALPAASGAVARLESASAGVETALANQIALADELSSVFDELDEVLATSEEAFSRTDDLFGNAVNEIEGIRGDLDMLGSSDAISDLLGIDGLDAGRIADFMGSPTEVVTEELYELNAYGSAMAPLFMNLTFWIGAFMLLVVMRQEVDSEGIRHLTLTQRYVGRYLLFAILVILQAVICALGVLLLGVQAADPIALVFASACASLTYLSIIYALSVTLQHIGKGLCIVLVFVQIPGATGLYPIEMTSPFFQAVYPFLPFTYGISALRESICGFYGTQYAAALATLFLFFAIFMTSGVFLRPLMGNVNRMVAAQVRQSGIFNGENVELPMHSFRISQMMRVLFDRKDFKADLMERYERFEVWRPRIIRISIALGVSAPIVLMLIFTLTPTEKVVMLTILLAWMVLLFVALIVMDTIRYSLQRQLELGGMDLDEMKALYAGRDRMEHTPRAVFENREGDGSDA